MPTLYQIVRQARSETGTWTHPAFAKLLGCSVRTVQRHPETGGVSARHHYDILIRATHANNPGLAAQLAAAVGTTLEAAGVAAPSDPTRHEHADSVLCAAADVLQLPPTAVRAALAAAFARASEYEVTIGGLARLLAEPRSKAAVRGKPPAK